MQSFTLRHVTRLGLHHLILDQQSLSQFANLQSLLCLKLQACGLAEPLFESIGNALAKTPLKCIIFESLHVTFERLEALLSVLLLEHLCIFKPQHLSIVEPQLSHRLGAFLNKRKNPVLSYVSVNVVHGSPEEWVVR